MPLTVISFIYTSHISLLFFKDKINEKGIITQVSFQLQPFRRLWQIYDIFILFSISFFSPHNRKSLLFKDFKIMFNSTIFPEIFCKKLPLGSLRILISNIYILIMITIYEWLWIATFKEYILFVSNLWFKKRNLNLFGISNYHSVNNYNILLFLTKNTTISCSTFL